MKSSNIKIGVLGGIGPESTSYFYEKLIEQFQRTFHPKTNTDFPQIIINSIPAPEIIYSKKISSKEIQVYKEGIKELDKHNPDFIVMVCNTIHFFYEDMQKLSNSKIIDMRKAISEEIVKKANNKICVLGTPKTIQDNLYSIPQERVLKLSDKEIITISKLIKNFTLGIDKELQVSLFNNLLEEITCKTNVTLILGCTELSLLNTTSNKNIISSLDIMVESTIKELILLKEAMGKSAVD